MKRLLSTMLIGLVACGAAFGLATQKTNTVNLVLADVCDGTFNDFKFQLSGYDDQAFKFGYDTDLTGIACQFRITSPMDGTIYFDVPVTSITVSGTNATFSITRTNIPPPGSYYGELLSYESASTNIYRSIAQGKLPVTWSLYLNESNFFARATNGAGVGQVYVHPNWIAPPWLSSTSSIGAIYFTIANSIILSNWTDVINVKATSNLASIAALKGYTNYALTSYNWGDHSTNGYSTTDTWTSVSNTVTANATLGATAYGWDNHASYGYLSYATNLFVSLYAADRSKLGANLSGFTAATGSLTSVAYTSAVSLVMGRTYDFGFTFANYGTGTLSVAGNSMSRTTAGSSSNYFVYHSGEGSNLVIKLDGTGSGIGNASGIYCKEITNGSLSAYRVDIGAGGMTLEGAMMTNPVAHIAATGTNVHGLGTAAAMDGTNFATAAQGVLAASALQPGDSVTNAVDEQARADIVLTSNAIPTTAAQVGAVVTPTNAWTAGYVLTTSDGGTTTYTVAAGAGDFLASGTVPMTGDLNFGGKSGTNALLLSSSTGTFANALTLGGNTVLTSMTFGVTDTTAYRGDWGASVSSQVASLNLSTASLNTAVGNLNSATGSLNTAVGNLNSATNALNTRAGSLEAATNYLNTRVGALEVPYQAYSASILSGEGSTATITYALGSLIRFDATSSTTIVFNNTDYPTNGVNRVGIDVWAGNYNIWFIDANVSNATALVYTNLMPASLFFRKSGTNILWNGRQ